MRSPSVPTTEWHHRRVTRASIDILLRYGVALATVAVTIVLKLIFPGLGADHPFVLLSGAVLTAAWFGGRGPGLLATALVSGLTLRFFLAPPGEPAETGDVVAVIALVAEGTLLTLLTSGLRSAVVDARAASAESNVAHREAQLALAIRDEMLALWTQELRGPMADLEAQARDMLADFEREGYSGAAAPKLRKLVDDAARVGRATAGWDTDARPHQP